MNRRGAALLLVMTLLSSAAIRAEVVRDLHAARVPVADQGAAALADAAREAMKQVLVKVSGSQALLGNPVIASALGDARNQVQQYGYVRSDLPDRQLEARFEFDGAYITDLVTRAGAPVWTANRPVVLAWVLIEDAEGRRFVSRATTPAEAQALQSAFDRRGVPVKLPLFDLADTAAISEEDVWRLDGAALRAASARYGVEHVLAGRWSADAGGQRAGDWAYLYGETRLDRSVTATDIQGFLTPGVALVADDMAARYAVAPSQLAGGALYMAVTGVTNYADYAGIVSWLNGLELIDKAVVERVQGDRIELRLTAQAAPQQLRTIIELNEHLQPDPAAAAGPQLSYRWLN